LFLASGGSLAGFRFLDDDDNRVTRTFVGTSDGSATSFTLKRYRGSYGGGGLQPLGLESIGLVDPAQPFNLYLATLPGIIDPNDPVYGYTLDISTPKKQKLVFNAAPPAGHSFVCDMSFFYYARFGADSLDFEKFAHQLWSLKKVTLCSLRF
jgi:hypothetical protein